MVVILMYVLFWVAKEPLCVTHLLVYQSLTEHLRLSCTHLLHTLLNFPLPFNIPVILTYTNTSRVHAFVRLLVYFIYFLLSEFFSSICLFWYNLTARDDTRTRHWHATGTQIVRAKMTSLDAIFCRGKKSSFRSLARFCRRKHKKIYRLRFPLVKKFELDL